MGERFKFRVWDKNNKKYLYALKWLEKVKDSLKNDYDEEIYDIDEHSVIGDLIEHRRNRRLINSVIKILKSNQDEPIKNDLSENEQLRNLLRECKPLLNSHPRKFKIKYLLTNISAAIGEEE